MPTLLLRPMSARDAREEHRASTPLELFFDLTFVVAVSLAAVEFAHDIEAGHAARGAGLFAMLFFAIWWGWLNFTWFASAYDTDDWLYRLVTLVQMGGALTVAAGVPKAFQDENFTVVVIGYVIMRLALVSQWLRAARSDPEHRRTAITYAVGISVVQVLWIIRLALPSDLGVASFLVLVAGELIVPVIAERKVTTTPHPQHVAERYGLFTIIVLGEGVLASGNSVIESIQDGEHVSSLVILAVSALVLLAGMWWTYFAADEVDLVGSLRASFAWGYGHYLLFGAAAAVSSGIEVQIALAAGHGAEASDLAARLSIGVPVAVYVLITSALVLRLRAAGIVVATVAAASLVAVAFTPLDPVTATSVQAALLAGFVAYLVVSRAEPTTTEAVAR